MAQAVVQSSCTKLISAIGDEAMNRLNLTGEMQEMLEQLEDIHAVIQNAEKYWWMVKDWYYGKDWRTKVKDAAYMVSHMVDEMRAGTTTPAARNKMAANVIETKSKEMLDKIKKIKDKLKELQKESVEFDTQQGAIGREEDVEKILAQLSACPTSEGPIILLIHGPVGVGKATVAAMVGKHDRFKPYSRIWINESHTPPLNELGRYIISQLSPGEEETTGHGPSSNDHMDHITRNRLHEVLNGKKLLLVLHDLWIKGRLLKLLTDMFSVGGTGIGSTQVIVMATVDTYTQQDNLETHGVPQYRLRPLSQEICCTIIKQAAFRSPDTAADRKDLERITPKIAGLCKGLPLAAQLFGSVLQFKQLVDLEADQRQNPVNQYIKLIYRNLAPNLRLCLAYCAFLFQSQSEIGKEDLIQQWIALDLIEPSEVFSTTHLAEQYIRRLLDMSLLQTTPWINEEDMCAISFVMHGEVQLCAQESIAEDRVVLRETVGTYGNIERSSYAVVIDHKDKPLKSIFPDQKIRALRCLGCSGMNLGEDSFSSATCLRVLELQGSSIQNLPESICELRHLGYLLLSEWSGLATLPESFGNLINLLCIELSTCSELEKLPDSFGKLTKVVRINLSGCSKLKNLPDSFGKLTKLKHIDLSSCLALVNLPGSFGKLTSLVHINLFGCRALVNLPASFGKLTSLVHINLSDCPKLVNLPGSFGKLKNLVHINLSCCSGLVNLPCSFGKLTNLAHINLSGCSGLTELQQSFGKLLSLVHVNLSGCSRLATLPDSFGYLRNLLHVDLSRCHGLTKLPESFGKLKKLVHLDLSFWSCFEVIQTALCGLVNLQHLNLSHPCCYRAEYPRVQVLIELQGQLIGLKHLNLSMFLNPIFCNQSEEENRDYIEFISGFSTLEHLDLSHNIFLRYLPGSLANLNRLHTLDLSGCTRLKKVEECMAEMKSLRSVVLSNLESYRFRVGVDNSINNYQQLMGVRYKELEITCIEMMKSVEEARRIKLVRKQNLQKLRLSWCVNLQGSVEESALLGELVPPHSLQSLELHGYGSVCFPSWLTSNLSSFNLVEVIMDEIPSCSHLPPLGLLPNLQRVVLRRMKSITRIDAGELSSGNTAAFSRLSEFIIQDLGSLQIFTYYSGGEELLFPVIDKLVVHRCPNLSFVPLPPRAKSLVISDCNDVMVCWRNRDRVGRRPGVEVPCCVSSPVTEVTELVVERCSVYLSHWCLLNHLPGLVSLTITNCINLVSSPEIIRVLSSLQTLCFSDCHRMSILPEHLGGLSSLRNLRINNCTKFRRFPNSMQHLTSLESMHFSNCESVRTFPKWLRDVTSLQKLTIQRCTSVSSLPSNLCESNSLKDLHIIDCGPRLKEYCQRFDLGQIKLEIRETPTTEQRP